MLRQDFVLRIIEQFARALSGLVGRIRGRQVAAADVRAELDTIGRQAGLDLDVARGLDLTMLLMWLAPVGEVDPGRFWLMAELLFLDGLQAREDGDHTHARANFERALAILARLEPDWRPEADLSSAGERIAEIEGLLGNA